jgi:hypothetical protein
VCQWCKAVSSSEEKRKEEKKKRKIETISIANTNSN